MEMSIKMEISLVFYSNEFNWIWMKKKKFAFFFQWKNWRFINQIILFCLFQFRESGVIIIYLLVSCLFYVVVSIYVFIDFFCEQVNNKFFFPSLLSFILNWKLYSQMIFILPLRIVTLWYCKLHGFAFISHELFLSLSHVIRF